MLARQRVVGGPEGRVVTGRGHFVASHRIPLGASTHRVVMVGFENAQILDITGPLEVFSRAARWLRDSGATANLPYSVELVSKNAGKLRCSSGIELVATRRYEDINDANTILVAGGIGYTHALEDTALIEWLREQYTRVDRIASVCTGAFLLAAAGVLSKRSATTHWAYCDRLAAMDSQVRVNPDAIFVTDGKVITSGGVTSGMDMSLAMIESDWGQPVALAVAQELVMYLKRPGGQSQFSRHLAARRARSVVRIANVDPRKSRSRHVHRSACEAVVDEHPQFHAPVCSGAGHHAVALRFGGARRSGTPPARANVVADRKNRTALRLR